MQDIDRSSTQSVIKSLAKASSPDHRGTYPFYLWTWGGILLAFVIVIAVELLLSGGLRPHYRTYFESNIFFFKLVVSGAFVLCALGVFSAEGIPGKSINKPLCMMGAGLFGISLLWGFIALFVQPLPPHYGIHTPIVCMVYITLLSLPTTLISLWILKQGIVTDPARAGLAAGLLGAAISATAYTLICTNNYSPLIVVAYTVAVVITSTISSLTGRKWLRW